MELSHLLKFLSLVLYFNASSLKIKIFNHLESIWGKGIPAFAEYSMGSDFDVKGLFNRKIMNQYLISLYCLER